MKKLVALITIFLLGLFLVSKCKTSQSGIGEDSAKWLPKSASDISYSFHFLGTKIYECTISEKDFIDWMVAEGRKPEEIIEPIELDRYTATIERDYDRTQRVLVANGLVYSQVFDNGGGEYWAFDRTVSRVYYYFVPR